MFKKAKSEDKIKYDTFYSNSKAKMIVNERNIDDVFQSSNIQKSLGKYSGRITVLFQSIVI